MDPAILFKKGGGSCQVAGAVHCMTDTADFLRGGDLHGAIRHVRRSPELILVAVRIGEINRGAFLAFRGSPYRVRMRDFVLVEPAAVEIDVLGLDVKTASGHISAQLFGWRVDLGLKERADSARSTLPPHEAKYRRILLSHIGREAIDRPWRKAGGFICPVRPAR